MKPKLYTEVVLVRDVPDENLRKGDVAMYIEHLESSDGEDGAILELFNALGESIRIATVPLSAIEALRPEYMPTVRLAEPA